MKNLIFTLCFLLSAVGLTAQACGSGGITFSSQADIDNFSALYPNCTQIVGSVTISGGDIINLNGLSGITSIGGGLYISDSPNLTSLTGLDGLVYINGHLSIYNTSGLINFTGLGTLASIGGSLSVSDNIGLTTSAGLDALVSIGGGVTFYNNSALTSLAGLNALSSVRYSIYITYNPVLTSLSGLNALANAGLSLYINTNVSLMTITGLNLLDSVAEELHIINNPSLTMISGLAGLNFVKYLRIYNNISLVNLTGLYNIAYVGQGGLFIGNNNVLTNMSGLNHSINIVGPLTIRDNPLLDNCTAQAICDYLANPPSSIDFQNNSANCNNPAVYVNCGLTPPICPLNPNLNFTTQSQIDAFRTSFPNCTNLGGGISISGSDVTNLNGLSLLTSMGGLSINNTSMLTNLMALNNLTSIDGGLSISSTSGLMNFTGLSALTSIGRSLSISGNTGLVNSIGLDALVSIGGGIEFNNNPAFTSLVGLDALTSVRFSIFIAQNPALISLSGLNSLTTAGFSLYINANASLQSVTGLNSLDSVAEQFYVINNPLLTNISGVSALNFAKDVRISGNSSLPDLTGLGFISSIGQGGLFIGTNNVLMNVSSLNHLISITGPLTISSNPLLNNCAAKAICNYLTNPPSSVAIGQNSNGCNSPAQVLAACAALPTSLTSFSAKHIENKVLLSWQTATEQNNDYFQVEHSQDGRNFKNIGSVKGHGNSTNLQSYTFMHPNPSVGANYYRLKQVDFDGQHEYSRTISVQIESDEISIFPNPTTGIIEIQGKNTAEGAMRLTDHLGRLIKTQELAEHNQIDISSLPKGMYFVEIMTDHQSIVRRVVKN